METKDNIHILIERSKERDSIAFSELYSLYAMELYRFSLYMTASKEDAEDAVQETVFSAWRSINSLKDNSLFKPWLFKILSNKCKTLLTAKNKQPDILPAEEYEFLVDNIEGNFDDSLINTAELKEALSKLTPPDAQIIILSIIGGFKSHELAVIYDMPANTIRSRQQRALKQLREILA